MSREAFDRMLGCFDADRERAAEKYERMHLKLMKFFEWEGCPFPDHYADETFNRVARIVSQGKEIQNLNSYFFGVARMLFLEWRRERDQERKALTELSASQPQETDDPPSQLPLNCLERCLENLASESREFILKYYQGEKNARIENRKKLGEALGIPANAMRNRALRLRGKLESCVNACLKGQPKERDISGVSVTDRRKGE